MSCFEWTLKRQDAALLLSDGYTEPETAGQIGVSERTVRRWKTVPEFEAEVNRLAVMTGAAHRAERLKLAKRTVRKLMGRTNKDLLEWLKYIQSETDGAKIDLTDIIAAFSEAGASVAGSEPVGTETTEETEEH